MVCRSRWDAGIIVMYARRGSGEPAAGQRRFWNLCDPRPMLAINFYTQLYEDMLLRGRKTATIRLGDKSDKYSTGEIVWITVGQRFGRRRKLFSAIIDSVTVKPSPR